MFNKIQLIAIIVTAISIAQISAQGDITITPNAHLHGSVGASTSDKSALASHSHDPNDDFSVQGLVLSLSGKKGDHIAGFVSYIAYTEPDNRIGGEWEEAFLKIQDLPGGLEFRGGRMLNRVSTQNNVHLHGWSFVDANLTTTRFFGEEALLTNSIEASYMLPIEHTSQLSVAWGETVPEDEEDEGDLGGVINAEGANYDTNIITARLKGILDFSDFHQFTYGATYINGGNVFGRSTNTYEADISYLWRKDGFEADSNYVRATTELIHRDFDYISEDSSASGSANEWGVNSSIVYGFHPKWELGARYDYVEGIDVVDLPERHRFTAAITRKYSINDYTDGHVRLQYNHDEHSELGASDTVWLQFGINWGRGGEVR